MNTTLAVTIKLKPVKPWSEILVAELSELNFDAFEEIESGIIAYGNEDLINKNTLIEKTSLSNEEVEFEINFESLPYQNWNQTWEEDFKPVFIAEKLAILAPFHEKKLEKDLNIYIQPKMSFGTGHHQTTWMMANALLEMKVMPNSVLDMGTGTGVLAILAEKLGANEICAIDIEEWSVENTVENAARNNCKNISAKLGGVDLLNQEQKFDLILANINKNVLKKHLNSYLSVLNSGGKLLISGFFDSDAEEMISFATNLGFKFVEKQSRETWAQLTFEK